MADLFNPKWWAKGWDNATTRAGNTLANGGADYVLYNSTLSSPYYSHANPVGFPDSFNYSLTFTGFSANPATNVAKFWVKGRLCFINIRMNVDGTSNAATMKVGLPITCVSENTTISGGRAVDNGSSVTSPPFIVFLKGTATMDCYPTFAAGNWTTSGGKRIESINGFYAI